MSMKGKLVQLNVSAGGMPKRPVERARFHYSGDPDRRYQLI